MHFSLHRATMLHSAKETNYGRRLKTAKGNSREKGADLLRR